MTHTKARGIQKYLTGAAYPCSREQLASHARLSGADEDVVQLIQGLPYDYYTSLYDVREAIDE